MPEIKSHTALRGIAALLVVIYHFRIILLPTIDLDAYTQFFAKGYIWVDCFFMLSGFILCYVYGTRAGDNRKECSNFLWARFARIYPLHVATLLGLLAIQICIPRITNQTANIGSWDTFWLTLIDVHAWGMLKAFDWNFPSWSISVEFAAYLAFPLICIALEKRRSVTLIVLSVLVLPVLTTGRDNWEQTALLHGLPMFFVGVLIFYFRPTLNASTLATIQVASIIALTFIMHFGLPDLLSIPCFAALVFSTQSDQGPARFLSTKPLHLLGNWSYSIYMLHIPVRIVASIFLAAKLSPILFFFVLLVLTLALGAASFRFFEMPTRRAIMSGPPRAATAY